MVDRLDLSRMHFPVTTLGPGKRIGIWFQGCSLQCPGCVSVDTWKKGKGRTNLQTVFRQIENWAPAADGVTISGGEPFEQKEALRLLLQYLKEKHPALTILVYSGYSFEKLGQALEKMKGLIDVLISEPFVLSAASSTLSSRPWMGSANQRMHFLNEGVRDEFLLAGKTQERSRLNAVDAMFDGKQLWMTGILKPGSLGELADHLAKQGHRIRHSQLTDQEK